MHCSDAYLSGYRLATKIIRTRFSSDSRELCVSRRVRLVFLSSESHQAWPGRALPCFIPVALSGYLQSVSLSSFYTQPVSFSPKLSSGTSARVSLQICAYSCGAKLVITSCTYLDFCLPLTHSLTHSETISFTRLKSTEA